MLLNAIGKFMFPELERWQRRRRMRMIATTVALGITVAAALAGFILWQATHSR